MTWMATNATPSSDRLRCSPVTTNRGRPGSRPWRLTSTPSMTIAVSSSRLTTPVALLAYQSAVLWVIPFIGAFPAVAVSARMPSRPGCSGSGMKHHRPGAGGPLACLSISSERPGLPESSPGWRAEAAHSVYIRLGGRPPRPGLPAGPPVGASTTSGRGRGTRGPAVEAPCPDSLRAAVRRLDGRPAQRGDRRGDLLAAAGDVALRLAGGPTATGTRRRGTGRAGPGRLSGSRPDAGPGQAGPDPAGRGDRSRAGQEPPDVVCGGATVAAGVGTGAAGAVVAGAAALAFR